MTDTFDLEVVIKHLINIERRIWSLDHKVDSLREEIERLRK
jgi:hypothetical protein